MKTRAYWWLPVVVVVAGCATKPAGSPVTKLFVAGDSTASRYEPNPKNQQGWAAVLQPYFDPRRLEVVDLARGGRSSRTFISEGHWDGLLAQLRAGDFVVIQFGHNDAGAINAEPPGSTRPLRARGTLPGIGDDSQEIDNVLTGKHETVYSYGWYVRRMIADVRAKGATPILLTLTRTNTWEQGRITCPSDTYRLWTLQTSRSQDVAFLDLSRIIADRYQREGPEAVKAQFIDDTVHTNLPGADANARDVVSGLRAMRALPLRKYLSKNGRKVRADRGPRANPVCPPLPPL
ncbi:MAG TPA: rhamnogalacturonan acetylesterase [Steroidobacteraceae bacterium]|nr:rhamnogalacturonan acetylesterase [Steroidobacteraceae bacterium]